MSVSERPLVTGNAGLRGYLEADLSPGEAGGIPTHGIVHLTDGQRVTVPLSLLVAQADGSYFLPLSLEDLAAQDGSAQAAQNVSVPIVAEEVSVGKRLVESGRLRIHKTVREQEEIVDEPLLREEATVETVSVNRLVEGSAPQVRQEGDVLIIPVLEEVLVVEKRLMLVKELHVRREQRTVHEPQTILLRREEVTVERVESGDAF